MSKAMVIFVLILVACGLVIVFLIADAVFETKIKKFKSVPNEKLLELSLDLGLLRIRVQSLEKQQGLFEESQREEATERKLPPNRVILDGGW